MKTLFLLIILFSVSLLRAQNTVKSYNIQVAFNKTVHIIFPSEVKYVDLGSSDIIAAKTPAQNVIRIKSAVERFETPTNLTVICDDGTLFSFNVTYSDKPSALNINLAENIFMKEYAEVSSKQLDEIIRAIYRENKVHIKYLGSKLFSIQMLIRGIYVNEGLFFIHFVIKNSSAIPLDIDLVRFKIGDKKLSKRTAIQETHIQVLSAFNEQTRIEPHSIARIIYVLPKISIPDEKQLLIELFEKDGARNQVIKIEHQDFRNAKTIEKLKFK